MANLPFLLESQRYSCEFRGESNDFQAWASRTFGGRFDEDEKDTPWLLMLTRADDREADKIGLQLAARGLSYRRVDVDAASPPELTLGVDSVNTQPHLHVGRLSNGAPDVIWFRHFNVAATRPPLDDPVVSAFVQSEWEHAARSFLAIEHTKWINPPNAVFELDRVSQLRLAGCVGLNIPATIVSSNKEKICDFVASRRNGVVAKVLGDHFVEPAPGELHGVFPRMVDFTELGLFENAYLTPSVYQEYVPHLAEVRATVIGRDVVAAEIEKASPREIWEKPEEVTVRHHTLPASIQNRLCKYLDLARLQYGAFDLLLTEDGNYIFLEVNPIGDWAWIESKNSDVKITEKVVSYISNLLKER